VLNPQSYPPPLPPPSSSSSSSSSSSFCGAGEIPPSALQPFEAYCAKPRFSSPIHLQRRSASDGVRDLY
jgi:hypothetical protein